MTSAVNAPLSAVSSGFAPTLAHALPADEHSQALLQNARQAGIARPAPYAGDVTPNEAFELLRAGAARLIDVRTPEERKFVGYVPESVAIPWAAGTGFVRNPRFLRELEARARKDEVLLFICRSGSRSAAAAEAATKGQFRNAFNVVEGLEGQLDTDNRRNTTDGWKFRHLPWIQD